MFAALIFLGGYEIAASTGARENSLSLHRQTLSSTFDFAEDVLVESAETSTAETLGALLLPNLAERLPRFVAVQLGQISEAHLYFQDFTALPGNPRAPPAL